MWSRTYLRPLFQRLLGLNSKKSVLSDTTLVMLRQCESRLEADEALRTAVLCHNKSDMYAWFQTTVLHVWLVLGRLYTPPVEHREIMSQELSDHLFGHVEEQLIKYGVTNPLAFNREYKRLAQIFHGTCVAYDKAYASQQDELLSKALWRNLLNQDPATWQEDAPHLATLVAYVKKQKVVLKFADPEAMFTRGAIPFAPLAAKSRD